MLSQIGWKILPTAEIGRQNISDEKSDSFPESPDRNIFIERTDSHELFKKLLAPISNQTFFRKHWERTPVHLKNEDRSKWLENVISTQLLQGLPNRVPEEYRNVSSSTGKKCILVYHAERFVPGLGEIVTSLSELFASPISGNLFYTPPDSQSLPPHWDTQEVFALHLRGEKTWTLIPPKQFVTRTEGIVRSLDQEQEGQLNYTLRPGDVLYIPRGWIHYAQPSRSDVSVHYSMALYPPTYAETMKLVINEAIENASKDPRFRRFCPSLLSDSGLHVTKSAMQELLPLVIDEMRSLNPSKIMKENLLNYDHDANYEARKWQLTQLKRKESLTDNPKAGKISEDTSVFRKHGNFMLQEVGEQLELTFSGRSVALPIVVANLMHELCSRIRFKSSELETDIPSELKLEVIDFLLAIDFLGECLPNDKI